MTTLRLVRHAPVTVKGVCYGQSDVPTTLDANDAAREILRQLDGVKLEAIHTSHVARTQPVAEAIGRLLDVPVVVDRRVAELSMGVWEGRSFADIEADDAARYWRWMERWRDEAPPGGETLAAFEARVRAWRDEARGRCLLAVTHAGVIRALRAYAAGGAYADRAGEPVPHLVVESMRNLR